MTDQTPEIPNPTTLDEVVSVMAALLLEDGAIPAIAGQHGLPVSAMCDALLVVVAELERRGFSEARTRTGQGALATIVIGGMTPTKLGVLAFVEGYALNAFTVSQVAVLVAQWVQSGTRADLSRQRLLNEVEEEQTLQYALESAMKPEEVTRLIADCKALL
jgi:hypothetical protein